MFEPFSAMLHWRKIEFKKLFAIVVNSVFSKAAPSVFDSFSRIKKISRYLSIISNYKYASLSAGIRNSKSLYSMDAMGFYLTSLVSMTDDWTGLEANISISVNTDTVSPVMATRMQLMSYKQRYLPCASQLLPRSRFNDLSSSLTFASASP